MADMIELLQFMVIPLAITAFLTTTLPALGTVLAIRNELLITLSLPSVAGLAISLLTLMGLGESSLLMRVIPTVLLLLISYSLLLKRVSNPVLRQKVLAGLFIGSQALTRLIVAGNPEIERYYTELLNGEMLSATGEHAVITGVITTVTALLILLRFPLIRSYSLDANGLSRFKSLARTTALGFRAVVILQVTMGVITIGPLLTTSLMIIPALFADTGRNGFGSALGISTITGAAALLVGFPGALRFDLPPAYFISSALIAVGIAVKLLSRFVMRRR